MTSPEEFTEFATVTSTSQRPGPRSFRRLPRTPPGKPVRIAPINGPLAITPDGRILYLSNVSGVITFATATNTPRKPIPIDGVVVALAVGPRP